MVWKPPIRYMIPDQELTGFPLCLTLKIRSRREPPAPSDIRPVSILDEMKRSYLDYAMSVIVARALPDARDGLKPVHRRILYSMYEQGHTPDKKYVKSARVVGDVIGKYHPHGDQSIYDAMVRMAQDFSMRVPLIDGQGNFGSVDGDPPAAYRYTEARLSRSALEVLGDIDKDTVDFQPNYDNSETEPSVLPAKFPNLLVNGAGGIAVGMATNIPPHNLGEVIDACVALIDDPALSDRRSHQHHPGTGFPDRRHHSGTPGHPLGLSSRPRLDRDARQGQDRHHPQGSRSHHHHGNSLPGEQGHHGRADRRTAPREEDRGHRRAARRIRSRRLSRRRRTEARRGGGCGAEPALSVHAAAVQFPGQHAGAGPGPAADDEPEGLPDAVRGVPRAGDHAPDQVPAQQGPRPRPYLGRPCDCGRQYRRGHPGDPDLARSEHRARHPDVAGLAGQGRRGHDHADRRSPPSA